MRTISSLFVLTVISLSLSKDSDNFIVDFDVQLEAGKPSERFAIKVHPDWAPLGAARFREIIEQNVYHLARFFRVVDNFVVQWGIPGNPTVAADWREKKIKDDPVVEGNKKYHVTFAKSGENTRTTQVFINYKDNDNLDAMGFPAFGEVIEGFAVVDRIYKGYGEKPDQGRVQSEGNKYLKKEFPNLSYIKNAAIRDDSEL